MRRRFFAAGLAAAMIAGLQGAGHAQTPEPVETAPAVGAQATTSPAAPPAAAPAPADYTVPAGTKVLLALKSGINTRTARPGDGVYLVSTFPVVVDRRVLIPSGVYVQGVVVMLRPLALEPAQLAGIGDTPGQAQFVPAAQPQPMKRPRQRVLCPPGGLGCN